MSKKIIFLLSGFVALVLGAVKDPNKRYRIWKRHEQAMSRYDFDECSSAKELVTSFRALFYRHPRSRFETLEMDFENLKMPVPVGYDAYLTRIYGDYLSYPAEAERTAKHDVVMIDLHNSYRQYRGKKYLVSK